jgi:hypothetical protein
MSYLHHYLGLIGCMLFMIAVPLTIIRQPGYSRKLVTVAIFSAMALAIVPIHDLAMVAYVRAGLGNLSITSTLMLCLMIATAYSGNEYISADTRRNLYRCTMIAALVVYPTGLGLSLFDGYALGYGNLIMLLLLVGCVAGYIWRGALFIPAVILLGITAYLAGLLESDNLWDYLLDPWITLVAIISGTKYQAKRLLRSRAGV